MGKDFLEGRTAVVTGSTRGIGYAIAAALCGSGATVVISGRSEDGVSEAVRRLTTPLAGGAKGKVLGKVADVRASTDVEELFEWMDRETDGPDILVNNAGITRDRSFRKMTDSDRLEVIETNLNSLFYCTSTAVPAMIEQKYGRIVNIASFSGQAGNFGQANYAASKGGIIAFTKVLALELAKYNITANVVAPGFTATDMLAAVPDDIQDQIRNRIPLGRFAQPQEIAKAVAFLICDGDYVTGQQININGGIYM